MRHVIKDLEHCIYTTDASWAAHC